MLTDSLRNRFSGVAMEELPGASVPRAAARPAARTDAGNFGGTGLSKADFLNVNQPGLTNQERQRRRESVFARSQEAARMKDQRVARREDNALQDRISKRTAGVERYKEDQSTLRSRMQGDNNLAVERMRGAFQTALEGLRQTSEQARMERKLEQESFLARFNAWSALELQDRKLSGDVALRTLDMAQSQQGRAFDAAKEKDANASSERSAYFRQPGANPGGAPPAGTALDRFLSGGQATEPAQPAQPEASGAEPQAAAKPAANVVDGLDRGLDFLATLAPGDKRLPELLKRIQYFRNRNKQQP